MDASEAISEAVLDRCGAEARGLKRKSRIFVRHRLAVYWFQREKIVVVVHLRRNFCGKEGTLAWLSKISNNFPPFTWARK